MCRERREMSRNDIDVGENMPDEDPPTPTEATPMIEDPESTPKFSVGNYVTVLPDTTARSECFWGYQGYIQRVDTSKENIFYEVKNSVMHRNNGLMVPQGRVVMSAMNDYFIRDGVKRACNVVSRGSGYVESMQVKTRMLLEEKKKLRKKNLTKSQTIEKLEKENKLLNEQCNKLINEHEDLFNTSFDAILNERGTKDSPLMKKVKEEVRGGFRFMRSDAERHKHTRASLDDMRDRVEKVEEKLRVSVGEAISLQEELKDKTQELSKICKEAARVKDEEKKQKKKQSEIEAKVDKLEIENEKLTVKLGDIESDERFKRVNANGSLGLTYKKLLQRLFLIGLSIEQVQATVQETFGALGVEVDSMSATYLRDLRMDLGPICDILCGLKLAAAIKYTQLDHDGSSIFGQDNMAVTVTVEYIDGTFEDVLITSSFLACSKDAESQALSIREVMSRIKEKYEGFLAYCKRSGAVIDRLPSSDGIDLIKFRKCSIMSDNAAPALATSNEFKRSIIEAVRLWVGEGDFDEMESEARDEIVNVINLRCFAHIRCLCANDGVKLEDEFMKLHYEMPESWREAPVLSGLMKSQLNDLIFSIQKYLYDDKYDTSYGARQEFINFMAKKRPTIPILDLGRAGNGNRFDMEMYHAYRLAQMQKRIMEFCMHKRTIDGSAETIINKSILSRLSSKYFRSAIVCRAKLWMKVYYPLRNLCQGDLDDFYVYDMCKVADALYETATECERDPSRPLRRGFVVFSYEKFPSLASFDRRQKDRPLSKLEMEAEVHDDMDHLECVEEIMKLHFAGIVKSLHHNASQFLTAYDGEHCEHKWTEEMKTNAKSWKRENVSCCESVFAFVDYVYRRGGKGFKMGTVDGIARAAKSNLYENNVVKTLLDDHHVDLMMSFVGTKKNRDRFKKERDDDLLRQQRHKQEQREAKEKAAQAKAMEGAHKCISVFYLQRVKTIEELRAIMLRQASEAAKMRVLKKQLLIYSDGFGWEQWNLPLTTYKKKKLTSADLQERLEEILSAVSSGEHVIPIEPPTNLVQKEMTILEDQGYETNQLYKDMMQKRYREEIPKTFREIRYLSENYGCNFVMDWDDLREVAWPKGLSDDMKRFKPGKVIEFNDFDGAGEECRFIRMILGLQWDDGDEDEDLTPQYCVYMYDPRKGDKPTRKDDEGIEFAYFKSEYDVNNNVMLRESIMDWDGLVIRDETDEEKAASAPQSATKRRRRGDK